MNILVTGASGFFGTGIVRALRDAGHQVTGASRSAGNEPGTVALDITSAESCARALAAAAPLDAVVHAAALAHVNPGAVSESACYDVNTRGTENMLAAAADTGVRRFLFISSIMVYGDYDLPQRVGEDAPRRTEGVYGRAKVLAEAACSRYTDRMDIHVLRLATMYDGGWFRNIRKRVRPLARGPRVYFTLDPDTRRYSLCSLRNGAQAVRWAVEGRLPPGTYNVADDHVYTQREILSAVERREGSGVRVPVPSILPRTMWHAVRLLVPMQAWRANAHSRYWKFCEHNVYATDRLRQHGFTAEPHLLSVGAAGDVRNAGQPAEGSSHGA